MVSGWRSNYWVISITGDNGRYGARSSPFLPCFPFFILSLLGHQVCQEHVNAILLPFHFISFHFTSLHFISLHFISDVIKESNIECTPKSWLTVNIQHCLINESKRGIHSHFSVGSPLLCPNCLIFHFSSFPFSFL